MDQLADEYCQKAAEQADARRQRRSADPRRPHPAGPRRRGRALAARARHPLPRRRSEARPARRPLNRQFIAWLLALLPTEQIALLSAAVDNQIDELAGRRSPNEPPRPRPSRWMVDTFGGALDGELADRAAKAGYAF